VVLSDFRQFRGSNLLSADEPPGCSGYDGMAARSAAVLLALKAVLPIFVRKNLAKCDSLFAPLLDAT
jgi:hypothetical protein